MRCFIHRRVWVGAVTHKAEILMIQNQSKRDSNHPLERVLTVTICQAVFNHDGSLEAASVWVDVRQTDIDLDRTRFRRMARTR